ncbi:MAG: helix-turn-helix domain-containing protein [Halovenus sp.]
MTSDDEPPTTLSPDDAFAVLGNETRMDILQVLGDTEDPLSFTEVRDRVGVRQGAQFNYHLDKLVGHFVRKTDDGYTLRQAGRRVIEAILSGTVTETAYLKPTVIEASCPFCGSDIEMTYREERMLLRCPDCPGSFAEIESTSDAFPVLPRGSIALYYLPSAGIDGRSRREMVDAVLHWTYSEHLAIDHGVCPRCSGAFEFSIEICDEHSSGHTICPQCNCRYSILIWSTCSNCNHSRGHMLTDYVFYRPNVRPFFEERGVDPILPDWQDMAAFYDVEETLVSADPFVSELTYTLDGDSLTVTVDEALNVTTAAPEKIGRNGC